MPKQLLINGVEYQIAPDGDRTLLRTLRDELGLTGTKLGCGEGACGACTVLVGRRPVRSCVAPLSEVADRPITTIEGLPVDGVLHPVQQAFAELGALQCGYCTPGWIMSISALLAQTPDPDEDQINAALSGNVCRCGTYPRIRAAIVRAAELLGDPESLPAALPVEAGAETDSGEPVPWDLAAPDERDAFSRFGDGLLSVLPPDEVPLARRAHPQQSLPALPSGGAWVHVAASGRVTAFTGKVEAGQGTRTALVLLVAEELRVPPSSVRVLMGDTDVCPYDPGTFGSRSMPDAGERLRAVAAAARQALVEEAAARLRLPVGEFSVVDGTVGDGGSGSRIGYGALLAGARRTITATAHTPVTSPGDWSAAGRATGATTATDAVTGNKRFPSDLSRPGMLHGRVLRPPAYRARLSSADLTEAESIVASGTVPGVVVHDGQFVGVAADTPDRAERALASIRAEWEFTAQPSEANLDEYLRANPVYGEGWNAVFRHEAGDTRRALDDAAVRHRATFTAAYIAHLPMEPRAALADWSDGRLTVWTGTQQPFNVRRELAKDLGTPEEQVRVSSPDFGGGFGGKRAADVASEAARLARASGRPVKVQWTRAEEFIWSHFRPAAVIDVESGADPDGSLVAWSYTNINSGASSIVPPYRIPNQDITFQPADSPLPQGPFRALAATANSFARESHLDELSRMLGVDPLELRLRHLDDERLAAVLRAAADRFGWDGVERSSGTGVGIAAGVEKGGRVATCARVRVDERGRLEVLRLVTAFECGAIVNPDNLANQVEGATVMGLSGALYEAVHFADGRIENPAFSRYRVARLPDTPPIEVVLVNRPDQPSAGGGETPIIAVAPAIANAIHDATGVRLRSMPLAPDGVVRAG